MLAEASDCIRAGGVVAYPTEHFYGLGADPFNTAAVARLFALKCRSADKPILVGIADLAALERLTDGLPDGIEALLQAWPRGLTLILPAAAALAPGITAATGTVGVRLIQGGTGMELIRQAGGALTATSANPSGAGATGDPERVAELLPDLDMVIDAGVLPEGRRSTIVDVTKRPWRMLRDGAAAREAITPFGVLEEMGD